MLTHLLMIGCGHMGYAMLRPWVESRAAQRFSVVTPRLESLHGLEAKGVTHIPFASALRPDEVPDVVVLAVKPQILDAVLADYRAFAAQSLFLSVVAGKPLALYEKSLGTGARIVRAMPNLPAKVGAGACLMVASAGVSEADKKRVTSLMAPLGLSAWLPDESMMDAATALSGCGPAYFYYMTDVLAAVGAGLGLPQALATQLAKQTLLGSAALWTKEDASAKTLYESIAVTGGMTEAALAILQEKQVFKDLMEAALKAAAARGKKLAS